MWKYGYYSKHSYLSKMEWSDFLEECLVVTGGGELVWLGIRSESSIIGEEMGEISVVGEDGLVVSVSEKYSQLEVIESGLVG